MESFALMRRRWPWALVGVAVVVGVWLALRSSGERPADPPRVVVPAGTRIRVEVLNASDVRGLGRRATLYLRDAGFDVVRFSGDDARRDSTLILDRTGHPEWARLASEALGGAPVVSRPDSARFVDLTILVGATWRPPSQTLYP